MEIGRQCDYEIISIKDYASTRYFIKLIFNRHFCIQIEIDEMSFNSIIEEQAKEEI